MTLDTATELINPADAEETDDPRRITLWCEPYSLVRTTYQECIECGAISGEDHAEGCPTARINRGLRRRKRKDYQQHVAVASGYGEINYMNWCREEVARHAAKGRKVHMVCRPANTEPEAADWVCLVGERNWNGR